MVLNRKVRRTMAEHKSQYIGSIILIILSCMIFTLFSILSTNLDTNNRDFQNKHVQENAHFTVQKPLNNLQNFEKAYHARLEKRLSFDASFDHDTTLRLFSPSDRVNKPFIQEGHAIRKTDEILLDPSFARAQDLSVGDSWLIGDQKFRIAGFMVLPDYMYPLKSESDLFSDSKKFGIGVISEKAFKQLNHGAASYSAHFDHGADKIAFKQAVNRTNRVTGWLDSANNPRILFVNEKIKSIQGMTGFLPIAILLLTCGLVSIILWRTLKTEFVQIGTLYALGYKRREIMRHYLSYAWVVSFIGSALGTAIGLMTVKPMLQFFVGYFNVPIITMYWNPPVLLLSILLPALLLVPVTWLVIHRALKMSPLELMRGGKKKSKTGFLEHHLHLNSLRFKNKFRIRELVRNVPRTLLMVFGVTFASMLLLLGFGLQNSIQFMMDGNHDANHYEYNYLYNSIKTTAESHGEAYSVFSFAPEGKTKNAKNLFSVYGVRHPSDYLKLPDSNGHRLSLDQTIITRPLADKLAVSEGSTIKVTSTLDNRKHEIKINKITQVYTGTAVYMPIERLNTLLDLPSGSHNGVWSDKKLSIASDQLANMISRKDTQNSFKAMLQPLQATIGSIALIAFLIGLIIVYVMTSLVIEENKETISMLKVFGYKQKEIYSLVLSSNTLLVILGYALAVPLIILSLGGLFRSFSESANLSFPIRLSTWSIIIGFVIILITYGISRYAGKRKIGRIPLSDILK
ncbi:FtsX-like permease family protein [Sporolactobacillus shoreicorticis]|uniref:ABC transporter permease n=1 Tax=Sporolactobacillus shoreicorticis TaxID=1923877 RepID=A0ABW5SAI5_9BACL|nr:FtsX-like permease family protein [Sporolactobacillus shoreicorticis]MCO7125522.1 FtsX-like permease family protein [Sporolactobacillus shoreicorticis]